MRTVRASFFWGCSLLLLAACAREQEGTGSLRLRVSFAKKNTAQALQEVSVAGLLPGDLTHPTPSGRWPAAYDDINCIGINVMGPGIAAVASAPNRASMAEILSGSRCSYPGVLSDTQAKPAGSTTSIPLTLRVPFGDDRIVQVIGLVNGGATCPTASQLAGQHSTIFGIYELARTRVDVRSNDQTVALDADYTENTAKEIRCDTTVSISAYCADKQGAQYPGAGTSGDPYKICSLVQWQNWGTTTGDWDKYVDLRTSFFASPGALTNTIGNTTTPFTGIFQGHGNRITYQKSATGTDEGLFGKMSAGLINNLAVTGTVTGTATNVGLLAGQLAGTGQLTNSSVAGAITGAGLVGGLVGFLNGATISNSKSTASVTCTSSPCGGAVGRQAGGGITSSVATGNVVAAAGPVGGFIGLLDSGTILKSAATGSVSSSGSRRTVTSAGGFVGRNTSGSISESLATGNVSAFSSVGGFVGSISGSTPSITNCYSTGSVTASDGAGGFAGSFTLTASTQIQYCYTPTTSVTLTSGTNKGGFGVMAGGAAPTDVYSNIAVTPNGNGYPTSGDSMVARTTGALTSAANYVGWDFNTAWTITEGVSPPKLTNNGLPVGGAGQGIPARSDSENQ